MKIQEKHDFAGGKLELLMIKLEPNAIAINKTLEEIIENYKHIDFRALAIHRRQNTFIPKADDVFLEGDLVYVITKPHAIRELMQLSGKTKFNINNVMIVGGSRVGKLTAKRLLLPFILTFGILLLTELRQSPKTYRESLSASATYPAALTKYPIVFSL